MAKMTGHKSVSRLENYVVTEIRVQKAVSTGIMTENSFSETGNKQLTSAAASAKVAAKATNLLLRARAYVKVILKNMVMVFTT